MRGAAVLVSMAASLAVLELAVRILAPVEPPASESQIGDGSDLIQHDDHIGWVLVPHAATRQKSAEFDVAIVTNAAGQRETADYPPIPPPGRRRVVALGDSFTFGYGVEQSESYPELLERSLPDLDVVNCAVPGYGVDQMLLLFEQSGRDWHGDVVLLGLFEGVVFRDARSFQLVYPKPRFELAHGELELTNVPVPPLASTDARAFPLASLVFLGTRTRDLYEHLGYGEAWPLTERILAALRDAAGERGARVLAVLIPKDRAVYDRGLRQSIHLRTMSRLAALLERDGIPFVDTTPALAAWAGAHPEEPLYYASDGHWNAAGHRVAARAIEQPLAAALAASAAAASTGRE